tara:strand:+ start:215 stop:694 length:480 start_codon:yes stop_codon:yes gene_type:complete
MYTVAAISIFSGYFHNYQALAFGLAALFIWDALYATKDSFFSGRTAEATNEAVTRARTYLSWYIGLYGVIIGLAVARSEKMGSFIAALDKSGTPIELIGLPLVLSIFSMLFIPIQIGKSADDATPNTALRTLFFIVVYLQKVILILIAHIGLRVTAAWS